MDVDKLKKMNVLADTLKQHGLAATREDAASLAGSMVTTPKDESFCSIAEAGREQTDTGPAEVVQASEESQPDQGASFGEDQIKNILQNFADQFCSEVKKLNQKLDEQAGQIEGLKAELDQRPQPASEPVAKAEPLQETAAEQTVAPEPAPSQVPEKPAEPSPRSGGFNSDDVSIEKFFYYGQR